MNFEEFKLVIQLWIYKLKLKLKYERITNNRIKMVASFFSADFFFVSRRLRL